MPNGRLIDLYQNRGWGLQVIVKLTSIELTPEKPEFPAGSWHVSISQYPSYVRVHLVIMNH